MSKARNIADIGSHDVIETDSDGVTVIGDLTIPDKITHSGDTNTALRFPAADTVTVETSGLERMRIDSSGRVGIRTTSPAQELHIVGKVRIQRSINPTIEIVSDNNTGPNPFLVGANSDIFYIKNQSASGFGTGGNIIQYTEGGNLQLMGTNYIDSSGNVGIGTSSPASALDVVGTVTADGLVVDNNSGDGEITIAGGVPASIAGDAKLNFIGATAASGVGGYANIRVDVPSGGKSDMYFQTALSGGSGGVADRLKIDGNGDISFYEDTGTTPKFFWDASAESLGIGTSLPAQKLHVAGNILMNNSGELRFIDSGGTQRTAVSLVGNDLNVGTSAGGNLKFYNGSSYTERMRIDSSGNLLVGTTDNVPGNGDTNTGVAIGGAGYIAASVGSTNALNLNRNTNDGDIAVFRKDGTTVGSIGAFSGYIYIANNNGDGMALQNNSFRPATNTGANQDNVIDLGLIGSRFDDIYATNGTIQTSDRNEKQDIAELDEAERRVAVAAKGLLRKFRWKDAVVEKGDAARIHFGIIAQDLQAAFEAEGLDAGRYAMFIHSTWTDEETGEERSRMGVRYSELLAFIIAAI